VRFWGERVRAGEWLGIVLIVVGVICLALPSAAPVSQVTEQGYDK